MKREIDVNVSYDKLYAKDPVLKFDESKDYDSWKKQVRDKYTELLGLDEIAKNACPLDVQIEETIECDGYTRIRYTFESEKGAYVPCYLLIPHNRKEEKLPVCVCLQGHTTGFHNSLGVVKYERDKDCLANDDSAFGLLAVKYGFIALCVEQRGMGERTSSRSFQLTCACSYPAMSAILLGRSLIGERVWDVSRAIDTLENFDRVDMNRIALTGNSGGGTATYYAACFEDRLKVVAPSCAVCAYKYSIGAMLHCTCNYIPGVAKYFDMGELACLIAPKKLLIYAGSKDPIFLIQGTYDIYDVVEKIYKKEGCPDNCALHVNDVGHHYVGDKIFTEIAKYL